LIESGVAVSMDGRGRALDNVFVERLWRTVKYEEVYLRDYVDGWQAEEALRSYFDFYCNERRHQSLKYRTPAEVYSAG
jgi:putative transposase